MKTLTKNGKWIALFLAWAFYGALTVAIIKTCSPGLATGLLFVVGSASYFTLINSLNNMDWAIIAGIIAKEGIDVAEAVFNKWSSGQMPTSQDFADLRALGKITPQDLVLRAADAGGIPHDHPQVTAFLALVAPPADHPPTVSEPTPPTT